ncbi:MAG: hypothetical protein MJE77_05080 [Proteobacteria bacterium]|nr:hypothetical protein [Pseudomonadota bacterium]
MIHTQQVPRSLSAVDDSLELGGESSVSALRQIASTIRPGASVDAALDAFIARANQASVDRDSWGLTGSARRDTGLPEAEHATGAESVAGKRPATEELPAVESYVSGSEMALRARIQSLEEELAEFKRHAESAAKTATVVDVDDMPDQRALVWLPAVLAFFAGILVMLMVGNLSGGDAEKAGVSRTESRHNSALQTRREVSSPVDAKPPSRSVVSPSQSVVSVGSQSSSGAPDERARNMTRAGSQSPARTPKVLSPTPAGGAPADALAKAETAGKQPGQKRSAKKRSTRINSGRKSAKNKSVRDATQRGASRTARALAGGAKKRSATNKKAAGKARRAAKKPDNKPAKKPDNKPAKKPDNKPRGLVDPDF